jgi:hypothetical protein
MRKVAMFLAMLRFRLHSLNRLGPSAILIASRFIQLTVLLIVCLGHRDSVAQQTVNPEQDPRYFAVAWVQQSAEFRLLTEQTYRYALTQLVQGLKDPFWSADEAQLQRATTNTCQRR